MPSIFKMNEHLSLVSRLENTQTFQGAAEVLLETLLDICEEHFSRSGNGQTKTTRASLHLRDDHFYKNLVVVERAETNNGDRLKPSTAIWVLVQEHQSPILLNVMIGEASVFTSKQTLDVSDQIAVQIEPSQSILDLSARETTHIVALPLQTQSDSLVGMVSLEFQSANISENIEADDIVATIETRLLLAAPILLTLPNKVTEKSSILPVQSKWARDNEQLFSVIAQQKQTLMINGPTGGGKTNLARWLHEHSAQREGPFIEAHLNQMSDDTGLPHLFGWKKGAYTGAVSDNPGWIIRAQNGTLFLDEVDTLSLRQQQALLQLLDHGEFSVLGTTEPLTANNVRYIVASNTDLRQLVAEGSFREDLFHRLNTLAISVPAITERRDEIPAWINFFADTYSLENPAVQEIEFSEAAVQQFVKGYYGGNLRELKATVIRACTQSQVQSPHVNTRLLVDKGHVTTSVELSRREEDNNPVSLLLRSAEELVATATRGQLPLPNSVLHDRGLLYDMCWLVAVQELGDTMLGNREGRNQVAGLMDRQIAVKNNNYGSELRRAMQRLAEFFGEHAVPLPVEIARILKRDG